MAGEQRMDKIQSIPITYSVYAGEQKFVEVPRSWTTRLFSLPWKPWVATQIEPCFEPGVFVIDVSNDDIYGSDCGGKKMIWAHPSFQAMLERVDLQGAKSHEFNN